MDLSPELSPEQISPKFVEHIKDHRTSYNDLSPSSITHHARDWCIDGLHTNKLGGKTGLYGAEVAGGGARRVFHNDDFPLSMLPPYEFMEEVSMMTPDGKRTTTIFSAHMFCGELFIHGAVTEKDQKGEIETAWGVWQYDYDRLPKADRDRISLRKDIGKRGSAPVLNQHWLSGRLMIANPDYLNNTNGIAVSYPLTQEVWNRLLGEQREQLERHEVIFERK